MDSILIILKKKMAQGLHLPLYWDYFYKICIYNRSQVSVYRTIGPLVTCICILGIVSDIHKYEHVPTYVQESAAFLVLLEVSVPYFYVLMFLNTRVDSTCTIKAANGISR